MYCNVISMCNITCIYNEICHITNEIFQAQITIEKWKTKPDFPNHNLRVHPSQKYTTLINLLCKIEFASIFGKTHYIWVDHTKFYISDECFCKIEQIDIVFGPHSWTINHKKCDIINQFNVPMRIDSLVLVWRWWIGRRKNLCTPCTARDQVAKPIPLLSCMTNCLACHSDCNERCNFSFSPDRWKVNNATVKLIAPTN
jgi:hypothetical protein